MQTSASPPTRTLALLQARLISILLALALSTIAPSAQAYQGDIVSLATGFRFHLPAGWRIDDNRTEHSRISSKTTTIEVSAIADGNVQKVIKGYYAYFSGEHLRKVTFQKHGSTIHQFDDSNQGGGDGPDYAVTRFVSTPRGRVLLIVAWGDAVDEGAILRKDANYRFLNAVLDSIKP